MEMPFDKGSVLVLGGPGKNRYASKAAEGCGDTVQLDSYGASLQEHHIEGDQFALLVSCPIPGRPGLVATIFYGFSPAAALRVARLLFFYGWDSYLVFQNGKVVTRGTFVPPAKDLEVKLEYPT
jgi:hypothetical protein